MATTCHSEPRKMRISRIKEWIERGRKKLERLIGDKPEGKTGELALTNGMLIRRDADERVAYRRRARPNGGHRVPIGVNMVSLDSGYAWD